LLDIDHTLFTGHDLAFTQQLWPLILVIFVEVTLGRLERFDLNTLISQLFLVGAEALAAAEFVAGTGLRI
jgi:hypothetical protein